MTERPRRPASLRRRMVLWLLAFTAVVSVLVFAVGIQVHEHAEHAAWRSLLGSELAAIEEHAARDPGYRWQDSDTLRLYRLDSTTDLPGELRGLADGLHDNVHVDGRLSAVMVRRSGRYGRLALVLDIEDFHEMESFAERLALLGGIVLIVVTGLAAWLGVGRLVRPLSVLAEDIAHLRPGAPGQRFEFHCQLLVAQQVRVVFDHLPDHRVQFDRLGQRRQPRRFAREHQQQLDQLLHVLRGTQDPLHLRACLRG